MIYFSNHELMEKVSIVIPTFNDKKNSWKVHKHLIPCIESILRFTDKSLFEIIVVANGCTNDTFIAISRFFDRCDIKIVWVNEALGYSKANNYALKIVKYDYVVLLNDDCILLEQPINNWLEVLFSGFKDKGFGNQTVITGPCLSSFAGYEFLIGFCIMVKTSFLEDYGILDEEFSPGWGEDIDLCLRAKSLGFDFTQVGDGHNQVGDLNVGTFPIYHEGEATYHLYPELVAKGQKLHQKMIDRINSGYYDFE